MNRREKRQLRRAERELLKDPTFDDKAFDALWSSQAPKANPVDPQEDEVIPVVLMGPGGVALPTTREGLNGAAWGVCIAVAAVGLVLLAYYYPGLLMP